MNHLAFLLKPALTGQKTGREKRTAVFLLHVLSDDQIGRAGFVFDRDEHGAVGRPWPLPHQHQSGELDPTPIPQIREIPATNDPFLSQALP